MDRSSLMHDLTLMLASLSSWTEGKGSLAHTVAWKGYDLDTLDTLQEDGYLQFGGRSKTLTLTEDGIRHARELLDAYGISLDPDPQPQRFFRLHSRFEFSSLCCMRTLLVPMHTSFEDFHTQIQACLNWMNYHLYDFRLTSNGENLFIAWPDYETGGDPRDEWQMPGKTQPRWLNAATTYLDDLLPQTREMVYSYDYGDGWEIRITVLNQKESFASDVPFCWDGDGDAPPEDVGGEGGFERFLQALDNPSHEDYERLRNWGEGQGFERFSKRAANKRLAHWQDWARADVSSMPRTAQLAAFGKVLVPPATSERAQATGFTVIPGGSMDYGAGAASDSLLSAFKDGGRSKEDKDASLAVFATYLRGRGLKEKTIENHLFNVEFYLDTYLARMGNASVREGIDLLEGFLGNFFIHDCMWSSKASIKSTAASIKKFYRCMAWQGVVTREQYRALCAQIKERQPDWIAELEAWERGDLDDDWY